MNMPKCTQNPSRHCEICHKVKYGRIPRNLITEDHNFAPGQMLHIDFTFMSEISVRGFSAYLSVTCATTAFPFSFPVRNKRPPIDLLNWIFKVLERQGKKVLFIRVDEGGELARSSEVGKTIADSHIIMQSTGAYASHKNGIDKRAHRTYAEMIRSMIYCARELDNIWCYALGYATF